MGWGGEEEIQSGAAKVILVQVESEFKFEHVVLIGTKLTAGECVRKGTSTAQLHPAYSPKES